ncbi:MAG: hypothetical protein HQL50_04140 [Magnetococcales bacterium]|nr:hypothetical protein [Magnetococcales bacterium]
MSTIIPQGESFRRALKWLGSRASRTDADLDEAGRRFNLTPLEQEFLIRQFKQFDKETAPDRHQS